jgi:hypothetical protein
MCEGYRWNELERHVCPFEVFERNCSNIEGQGAKRSRAKRMLFGQVEASIETGGSYPETG